MKITVSQQQLARGLSVVSRAVSPRSTLPVLANILLETDQGRLRLSATNLELGISCWIGTQVAVEGAITVPARTLNDLVSTFPAETVTLTGNPRGQVLTVQCGASVTDIKGIDAQEFPPMPPGDDAESMELNAADFREMIQQVVFAASSDEARQVLMGVQMKMDGNELMLAATDGFRISIRKAVLANPAGKPVAAIIPARALAELGRILSEGDQNVTMLMPSGRGQVIFRLKDAELVSQLIDGNFPDCNLILPRSFKTRTILNTEAFLKACRQVEIIARESNNIVRLTINQPADGPGMVDLSAQSEETGSGDSHVDATIEGDGLTIAFNVHYLREVLEVIKTPSMKLETNANNTPGLFTPVGDEDFKHIIMPMHL